MAASHWRRGARARKAALLVGMLPLLAPAEAVPGEPVWKVGLARAKITPEKPVFLIGYRRPPKPFEGVINDIFAKALALEDRQGRRGLLITTDLVGIQASVARRVCARVQEKSGLVEEQILLNSSHTHCGPLLSLDPGEISPPGKATPSPEEFRETVAYTKQLCDKLAEIAAEALSDLQPARLAWGTGTAPAFVVNRRKPGPKGIWLGANPDGPIDPAVAVLRVTAPGGELRAVVFGCACHSTAVSSRHNQICGDYPGFAQEYLETLHPGVQAMFMMGCGADAAPRPSGAVELARAHGASLGKEVGRVLQTELSPIRGPLQTRMQRVELPLRQFKSDDELKRLGLQNWILAWVAGQLMAIRRRGEKPPTHYSCPIALWQFGGDLTLVALPGETVVDYSILLRQRLGPDGIWVAGYNNDLFGYLPSARLLAEGGGIETMGLYYGGVGVFTPQVEEVVLDEVCRLAKLAGRPLPP